jgi:predicted amidophosphoribosyltransferase
MLHMGLLQGSIRTVAAFAKMAADVIYPPRCPSCRAYVDAEGNFCAACFSKLRLIDAPVCACCGIPFVVSIEAVMRWPECLDTPPVFDVARSAMVYDASSAPLVTLLKFRDQWARLERYVQMSCAWVAR